MGDSCHYLQCYRYIAYGYIYIDMADIFFSGGFPQISSNRKKWISPGMFFLGSIHPSAPKVPNLYVPCFLGAGTGTSKNIEMSL